MKQFTDELTAVNTIQIIVFVVNFYREMKRFLKLFSCTKATEPTSPTKPGEPSIEFANFVQGD